MMTSAFFRTLSLRAEKNCAQNSGAKRRDDISSLIMVGSQFWPEHPAWQQGVSEERIRMIPLQGYDAALRPFVQQPFGSCLFNSVDHAARFVDVSKVFGESERGLHHHRDAHGEI